MENQAIAAIDASGRTLGALLRRSGQRLASGGIITGARDAEVLLAHALRLTREQLIMRADELINDHQEALYRGLLQRRLRREPVAYIVGSREFWSLEFRVNRDVLIPRPETELLVEIALEWIGERAVHGLSALRIADVGTGSGAIAVALASEVRSARLVATDISDGALALAQLNAERNHVAHIIDFIESDLFSGLMENQPFDLVLSNPTYIPSVQIQGLDPEVSCWEPRAALDGGPDGGDFYRRIAREARHHLAAGGALLLEIGDGMGAAVAQIFRQAGGWGVPAIRHDYTGRERAAILRRRAGCY